MRKFIAFILCLVLATPAWADSKLSALPNNGSPLTTDLMYDVASTTSYNITIAQLLGLISTSTATGVNWNSFYPTSGQNWQDIETLSTTQTVTGNKTYSGTSTFSGLTASQIAAFDGSKNLQSLAVATYPSLLELSYVKGLTSNAQTQITGKQANLSLIAGTYTDGDWCKYTSSGTVFDCNVTPITNNNQLTNGAGYITGNQSITLSGAVTGSGTTAIATTLANNIVQAFKNINWQDTTAMNSTGINWQDAVFQHLGINWDNVKILSTSGINWYGQTFKNFGINWQDFKDIGTQTNNWSDVNMIVRTSYSQPVVVTQSATPTINVDLGMTFQITGLAQAITGITVSGNSIWNGREISIEITDNGVSRAITPGTSFANSGTVTLPTATTISTLLRSWWKYDTASSKWILQGYS